MHGHIRVDIIWSDGPLLDVWELIEDGDGVGHAIGGWGGRSRIERGVFRQGVEPLMNLTGATDLAGKRLIHVELSGYDTAAIEVQVVLAAQFALLTERWLAGCPLLLKITAVQESTEGGQKETIHINTA